MTATAANGLTIEYESFGDPTDPAIVLIMGLGMQLVGWPDEFCQRLVRRGFRVVRFDNRDSGLSSRVPGHRTMGPMVAMLAARLGLPVRAAYGLEDMARDTVGLMDALGIKRAHVAGASMGGMIAQVLAARFPARVLSLTSIMSSSGNRKVSRPKRRALQIMMDRPPRGATEEQVTAHLVDVFRAIGSPDYPIERHELHERIGRWVRRAYDPAGTARQMVAVIASGDRRKLLREVRVPTLVIHGSEDPLVRVEAGHDTARSIAGAEMLVIDGMGHDLPDALLATLADAIARHCSAASAPGTRPAP